jgi:hypothetical protein
MMTAATRQTVFGKPVGRLIIRREIFILRQDEVLIV